MKKSVLVAVATIFAGNVIAEDLSVVGSWSGLPLHKQYEAPLWNEAISAASSGDINVSLTTHDQMGIKGGDVFRMLGEGVFDIGSTVADYAVSDIAALEGLDVPMVAQDAETARKMVDAARPMLDDIYAEIFNAKVLGVAPYPPQVVFCNAEIASLDDLAGLKIRASGRMTAKLLEALGAEGVTIGFGEVPGALQRGVVDCAVTGAGSGYSAGWWEVSTHLLAIPLGGWDPVVTAVNLDKWNSLSPEHQALLETEVKTKLEDPAWKTAQGALIADIACLTGNGECTAGDAHEMKLVESTDADNERVLEILANEVLPEWSQRAGGDWGQRWNDSVGQIVGLTIQ